MSTTDIHRDHLDTVMAAPQAMGTIIRKRCRLDTFAIKITRTIVGDRTTEGITTGDRPRPTLTPSFLPRFLNVSLIDYKYCSPTCFECDAKCFICRCNLFVDHAFEIPCAN